ncbi:hypothetical protein [Agrobacterium tumefaciens]|uniref:hypothetical protein n=1 Tax=Agrobacterium tumefaciens TaxID=358 RepID=UPI001572D1D9|nr:hypothetical protein [Agrobacterium tumefaciens]
MANEIRDAFREAYRDYALDGVPSSGTHKVAKKDVRNLGDVIQTQFQAAAAGNITAATWTQLVATPGSRVGQPGQVSPNDTGTHTDPVVGGTVPNGGEYRWSGSAWQRTGDVVDPAYLENLIDEKADREAVEVATASVPLLDHWDELMTDISGRPLWGRKDDGTTWALVDGEWVETDDGQGGSSSSASTGFSALLGNWRSVTIDLSGRPIFGEMYDGSLWQAIDGVLTQIAGSNAPVGAEAYTWNLASFSSIPTEALTERDYLVILIGQSWDGGYSYDSGDATVTTTAQHPGHALMTNAGVQPKVNDGAAAPISGYADLVESPRASLSYESPLSGIADSIMRGCQARFGAKPRIVFAISARGGTAYSRLRRGSPQYTEALRIVERCRAVSAAQGRSLEVLCMGSFHGQQDSLDGTSREEYLADINAWQTDLDADIRRITSQIRPIKLYMAQTSYRGLGTLGTPREPALAQLEAPKRNPYVKHIGPLYQNPGSTADGGGHLKAAGFYQAGLLMGKAMLEGEFGPKWTPLECVEAWWASSTSIMLRYNQALGLESDDARIKISNLGAGRGVDFLDGSSSPPTVSSIAIASGTTDTIEVILSAAPIGLRPRIFIAARAPEGGSGATTGNRSAIRTATAFDTAPLTGVDLYHWACQQVINLPPL